MQDLINALEDLELQMGNMQGHLRRVSWPNKILAHAANDVIVWLGLALGATERFRMVLEPLVEAKEEAKEAMKEEEGGEGVGEQVSEPEGGETGLEVPVQEPEAGAPKSRKRVRE